MKTISQQKKKQQLDRLIVLVEKLPALPQVTQKALDKLDNPNSTAKAVAEEISQDLILTGRILRIANSAFYGFPRSIKSIHDAIIILGFETVRNLILAASVHALFGSKMSGYAIKSGELWRHSLGCAVCAEAVAKKINLDGDEAFISGLMHDVGKVVMDKAMAEESKKILELVINDNMAFHDAEQEVLGYDHAEIGSKIAIKWNLPVSIVRAIQYHHKPLLLKQNPKMAAVIRFSDAACLTYGIGIGGEEFKVDAEKGLLKILGMSQGTATDLIEELGEKISDLSVDF